MPTSEPARPLLGDERGAIMVMGIFMCSCLVGALWYLAGIGDAILYRERMQEAADAIAFSDAALHARGMNLIVLVNLIMAVILSVRVGLRVGKLVCTIAAAIFSALSLIQPQLAALAAPAAAAAETLDQVDRSSKEAIDVALQGLVKAQDVISKGTPVIALAATRSLGDRYARDAKVVTRHTAFRVSDPSLVPLGGLPLEHTNPSKLCNEAASVLAEIQTWLLGNASGGILKPAAGVIGGMMQRVVALDTKYFCDLEGGASAPSTAGELVESVKERCKDLGNLAFDEEKKRLAAEAAWLKRCSELGVTCQSRDLKDEPLPKGIQIGHPGGPDAKKSEQQLDRLRLERDESVASVTSLAERKLREQSRLGTFGTAQCQAWATDDANRRQADNDALTKQHGGSGGDSGKSQGMSGVAPMVVKDFRNGSKEGQFIGGVVGDEKRFKRDSDLVRLGTFNAKQTPAQRDPENG
ncbi:MAG TPA: hypothetical protein VLT33_08280, partial [Labilithrix sp.]|nr:hypothetical protein [Labilithrix sp.]